MKYTKIDSLLPLSPMIFTDCFCYVCGDDFASYCNILFISLGTPSSDRFPCAPGTFTTSSSLYEQEQCTNCSENFYCLGGESFQRRCQPGYYCPKNTRFAEEYPCPNRTYNPEYEKNSETQCKTCTLGHFCEKATVQPYECPIGTYMDEGFNTTSSTVVGTAAGYQDDCKTCPAGYYCLNATIIPKKCGLGVFTKPGQSVCQVKYFPIFCIIIFRKLFSLESRSF